MRKCYVKDVGHSKTAYWDDFLGKPNPEDIFNFSYNKYIPKFDRFIPQGARILEGGCGLGQYVYYYTEKGFSVEGVDFSDKLIERARLLNNRARFEVADVRHLPFKDGSFDVYISNGVLEHFEEGPEAPLREAERVLKKSGILIVTLQYENLSRALADRITFFNMFKTHPSADKVKKYKGANIEGEYKLAEKFDIEDAPYFHSYFFSRKEAADIFKRFNLEIIYMRPLSVENGLGDYKFFRNNLKKISKDKYRDGKNHAAKAKMAEKRFLNAVREWLKQTFIQEEPRDPLGFGLLRILQACFGSMILVVCRKK